MPEQPRNPDRETTPDRHHTPDRETLAELPRGRSWALAPLATPEPHRWTRETLATLAPDLLAALLDEGARAERTRLQAIDALGIVGHEELVQRARYDKPIPAAALAVAILRVERARGGARPPTQPEQPGQPAQRHRSDDEAEIERAARLIVGDGRRHS
ncbi:MAG: hypothetical protein RBU45_25580 [Myxococcota bacterium]|jgi:hypothetical protein|nr:hypothetical protein [Myxococcota bacterium]